MDRFREIIIIMDLSMNSNSTKRKFNELVACHLRKDETLSTNLTAFIAKIYIDNGKLSNEKL